MDIEHRVVERHLEVKRLLYKYKSLLAYDEDMLGLAKGVQHKIPNDEVPVRQQHRRIPPTFYREVRDHIEDLLTEVVDSQGS